MPTAPGGRWRSRPCSCCWPLRSPLRPRSPSCARASSKPPGAADLSPAQTPVPGTTRIAAARAADPAGGPPWALRIARSTDGQVCSTIGQVRRGVFGIVGLDGVFRRIPPGITDACARTTLVWSDSRGDRPPARRTRERSWPATSRPGHSRSATQKPCAGPLHRVLRRREPDGGARRQDRGLRLRAPWLPGGRAHAGPAALRLGLRPRSGGLGHVGGAAGDGAEPPDSRALRTRATRPRAARRSGHHASPSASCRTAGVSGRPTPAVTHPATAASRAVSGAGSGAPIRRGRSSGAWRPATVRFGRSS